MPKCIHRFYIALSIMGFSKIQPGQAEVISFIGNHVTNLMYIADSIQTEAIRLALGQANITGLI